MNTAHSLTGTGHTTTTHTHTCDGSRINYMPANISMLSRRITTTPYTIIAQNRWANSPAPSVHHACMRAAAPGLRHN